MNQKPGSVSIMFLGASVLFALLVVFYCQGQGWGNRYMVNDDARQYLAQFYRWSDPALLQGDLLTDYSSALTPPGFKAIMGILLRVMDVISISRFLPFFLCPLTAFFLYLAGSRMWSAPAGFFASVCCVLYAWQVSAFSGGFPRAFAFPLGALFMYCCACRRFGTAGLISLLLAFFYPPLALVCGSSLVVARVAGDQEPRHWGRAVIVFLIMALGLAALVLTGRLFGSPWFGKMYTLPEMLQMPEFFAAGRTPLFVGDLQRLFSDLIVQERVWGVNPVSSVSGIVMVLVILACCLARRRQLNVPVFVWAGLWTAMGWYLLSWALMMDLFLPGRIWKYIVPLLFCLFAGAAFAWLVERGGRTRLCWLPWTGLLGLVLWSWPMLWPEIYDYSGEKPLYDFLSTLPADAMIAGHPRDMDGVPLFSKRKAFVTEELSLPFYRSYYREIQRRTLVLFSIYYATDLAQLKDMCAHEHIRYLVIRPAYFEEEYLKQGMFYNEPYNTVIKNAVGQKQPKAFWLYQGADKAIVFRWKDVDVFDVDRL